MAKLELKKLHKITYAAVAKKSGVVLNGKNRINSLAKLSYRATQWVGTPQSIIIHTFLFIAIFLLNIVGIAIDTIMLILTTAVSLEAIYLALFIQMTVNRNTQSLEDFGEDIEDIQEDVKELGEDVDDLSEDIEDIQEEDKKEEEEEKKTKASLQSIEEDLDRLLADISHLKKNIQNSSATTKKYLNG